MEGKREIERLGRSFGLLAVYLFGSRAEDGLAALDGEPVEAAGSDLDVGVVFRSSEEPDLRLLARLQAPLDELFEPLRVDLVPLQRVDALFQFHAMDRGYRILATDPVAADYYELWIMNRAEELLPIERRLEEETFGVSTE